MRQLPELVTLQSRRKNSLRQVDLEPPPSARPPVPWTTSIYRSISTVFCQDSKSHPIQHGLEAEKQPEHRDNVRAALSLCLNFGPI